MAIHPDRVSTPQKGHFTGARPNASSGVWRASSGSSRGTRLRITPIEMDIAKKATKIKIQIVDADIAVSHFSGPPYRPGPICTRSPSPALGLASAISTSCRDATNRDARAGHGCETSKYVLTGARHSHHTHHNAALVLETDCVAATVNEDKLLIAIYRRAARQTHHGGHGRTTPRRTTRPPTRLRLRTVRRRRDGAAVGRLDGRQPAGQGDGIHPEKHGPRGTRGGFGPSQRLL